MPPRERRLEAALGGALNAGAVPGSGRELVRYAGGRRALTEQLAGMPGPPKRSAYKDQSIYEAHRRRWRTASQAALRYDKGLRVTPAVPRETRTRLRRAATAAKRALLVDRGLRARMMAEVTVPSPGVGHQDSRARVMPSGGPGVYIGPTVVAEILGDRSDAAAEEFTDAFWDAYGMPESAEIRSVAWLKLWPDGSIEPK